MDSKTLTFQVTLALAAIIFTSFVSAISDKDWERKRYRSGDIPVADLCVNGKTETCTAMTLDQATHVCGKTVGILHFTNITKVKCNGATCHAEIATNITECHAGLDCQQKGPSASCVCIMYRERKTEK
uniref:Uncharacterized protein n=1 Tax=Cacopsylla melanoneura TaxID=428564 RepID=A0A8D8TRY4_9HEMI